MRTKRVQGADRAAGESRLLQVLGLAFGLAIVLGAVVGGGVMRTPGVLATILGNEWLILAVLVLGAVWALLGANVYAELGTMLPTAGAGYVYLRRAYGEFVGFAGGLNDFLINTCAIAYISIVAAEFLAELFPRLAGGENWLACALILTFASLHWFGVREGDLSQKIMSVAKALAFGTFVIACFYYGSSADNPSSERLVEFASPYALFTATMLAFQVVNESYAGWNSPVYFSEENTNPSRNIPRAMLVGIILVSGLYFLVYSALMYVLPLSQIAASKLPGADAAMLVFGGAGAVILKTFSIIATLGVLNAILMYGPRVPFAMARDKLLPAPLQRVNRGGTPEIALIALVACALVAALSGTFESLLALAAFFSVVGDGFVYLAIFILRRREPDLPRPFRAIGYPWLPLLTVFVALLFLVGYIVSNPYNSIVAVGLLLLIYPLFHLSRRSMARAARRE